MTAAELKDKIRALAKQVYGEKQKSEVAAIEYDELTKFPELKQVIVSLLGPQFDLFLASIDFVAPKPTTFSINLKNGENFYLVFTPRTFIAEVEGKRYYLLNLNELESATKAIARVLRYGPPKTEESNDSTTDIDIDAGEGEEDTTTDT
jgi:hypothetical protein